MVYCCSTLSQLAVRYFSSVEVAVAVINIISCHNCCCCCDENALADGHNLDVIVAAVDGSKTALLVAAIRLCVVAKQKFQLNSLSANLQINIRNIRTVYSRCSVGIYTGFGIHRMRAPWSMLQRLAG